MTTTIINPEAVLEAPSVAGEEDKAPALVSVIVLCCGQLEYTRGCLASVLRWTRAPFEVILLDAGSRDGTGEFLDGFALAAPLRAQVVHAPATDKLSAGVQACAAAALGKAVVLLQNDTLVVHGWVQQLAALGRMDPAIAVVGPMTSYLPPPQGVDRLPFALARQVKESSLGGRLPGNWSVPLETVDRFAREHRESLLGKWYTVDRLAGFCLYVKKDVLAKTTLEEDSRGLGFFDAAALCAQVRQAGRKVAMCRDLFIHQFGTRAAVPRRSS